MNRLQNCNGKTQKEEKKKKGIIGSIYFAPFFRIGIKW
jgi:hypothetical protein